VCDQDDRGDVDENSFNEKNIEILKELLNNNSQISSHKHSQKHSQNPSQDCLHYSKGKNSEQSYNSLNNSSNNSIIMCDAQKKRINSDNLYI